MKKTLAFIFVSFLTMLTMAQTTNYGVTGKYQNKFFKSYEDYKAGKPVEGVEIVNWDRWHPGKMEYKENGTAQKVKVSKTPYAWFTNEQGILMRLFDGDLYYMIVDGGFSYYFKSSRMLVSLVEKGEYSVSPILENPDGDYYSEGPNAEIKKLKSGTFEDFLTKTGLKDTYENDKPKREMKDNVGMWEFKKDNRTIKYAKLINEKLK